MEEGLVECQQVDTYAPVPAAVGEEVAVFPPAQRKWSRLAGTAVVAGLLGGAAVYGRGTAEPKQAVASPTDSALISETLAGACEVDGSTNCRSSQCCAVPTQFCFEKNEHWAACRESCVSGKHYLDPEKHRTDWSCKPLGGKPPPCNQKVRLLSRHSKFLCADKSKKSLKADREDALDWEEFLVKCYDDGLVALKTFHNTYVGIEKYQTELEIDDKSVGKWQKFAWLSHSDETVSLQAQSGYWLRATDKGEAVADAVRVGDWEKFDLIREHDFENPEYGCDTCGKGFCARPESASPSGKTCCQCGNDGTCKDEVDFTGVDNGRCSHRQGIDKPSTPTCSNYGENCWESKCCQAASAKCFAKNEHWAHCASECTPGIHEDDPEEHRTEWSCTEVEKPDVTKPVECAGAGENCWDSKCCQSLSATCFAKNEHWAHCAEECTEGIHEDDPKEHRTPWSCTVLEPDEDAPDPEVPECAKDGSENCLASHCCEKASERCFQKNEHWAACRETCIPGLHDLDPKEHRTPWTCKPLGGTLPPFHATKGIWLQTHGTKKYIEMKKWKGEMKADTNSATSKAKFRVIDMGNGAVALKSLWNKRYMSDQGGFMQTLAKTKGDSETFLWMDNRDGTFSLQAKSGRWVRALSTGELLANAAEIDDSAKFAISVVLR